MHHETAGGCELFTRIVADMLKIKDEILAFAFRCEETAAMANADPLFC